MSLRLRFNLAVLAIFLGGGGIASAVAYQFLYRNAHSEAVHTANLIMANALAVRHYTAERITPLISKIDSSEFLAERVPAFAAVETLARLGEDYAQYRYREPTVNPTNVRNRPENWELLVIDRFRGQADLTELTGTRYEDGEPQLYVARPIRITNPACLSCHTTPEMAPQDLVAKYGRFNGFGWELDDVVGAQVVTVPTSLPLANARKAFLVFIGSLGLVLIALMLVLNLMMDRLVIRPLYRVSGAVDEVSRGNFQVSDLFPGRKDEIGVLGRAVSNMQRSLDEALGRPKR